MLDHPYCRHRTGAFDIAIVKPIGVQMPLSGEGHVVLRHAQMRRTTSCRGRDHLRVRIERDFLRCVA
ncbi:hypothetical protein, partial [Escherichia coli]|uniref:hypothetical protein n=1 Tax=Escherichia coli TaxID=562 RepID=UPI001BE4D958